MKDRPYRDLETVGFNDDIVKPVEPTRLVAAAVQLEPRRTLQDCVARPPPVVPRELLAIGTGLSQDVC
jgi:hypothetical protein